MDSSLQRNGFYAALAQLEQQSRTYSPMPVAVPTVSCRRSQLFIGGRSSAPDRARLHHAAVDPLRVRAFRTALQAHDFQRVADVPSPPKQSPHAGFTSSPR